ncbi:sugar phosphate isomerase/epimerase family protein [Microvirga mediterraneensis]|uniref:TIM barrel protein n=1 Tax=Microvirga mediterraneensis TaxID=2754695 RepID=A0A838BNW6_9HYPH|nr:TIM barrel protein [Microvirga mediterraneensis]MBA1157051.1 TIM barrel protein [Microvirga mediterraneensis]
MKPHTPPPLGLAHFTCIDVAPLDLVPLAATIGYKAVGLRLYPAFPGAPFYALPAGSDVSREMCRRLDGEGVHVYDIEFVPITEDFVPASLTETLEAAGALGAKRLSVCGDDPDRARLIANFAGLCDLADQFGMGVDLEVMPWRQVGTIHDAAAVVRDAGRRNGGLLVDALHLSRSGGDPADVSALPPEFIMSAQLCDAPAIRPTSTEAIVQEARAGRLPPGQGDLPLSRLIAELPDHTTLSVEVPNAGLPAEEHLRRVFQAAQQTITAATLS